MILSLLKPLNLQRARYFLQDRKKPKNLPYSGAYLIESLCQVKFLMSLNYLNTQNKKIL
jgi:hypothetical protein